MSRRTILAFLLVACLLGCAVTTTVAEAVSRHNVRRLSQVQFNAIVGDSVPIGATADSGRKLLVFKCAHWLCRSGKKVYCC
jgi:Zn-dependent alcohol dehydrogenase